MELLENKTSGSTTSKGRRAATTAFAIVGFIALLFIGVLLAIYSARLIPNLTSKFTDSSVTWSSLFHKNTKPALTVVATTTLPIAMTTPVASTTQPAVTTHTHPVQTTTHSTGSYTVVNNPAPLYGTPDLYMAITDVGYLAVAGNTSSFVHADYIPAGAQGAVKFSVTNIGTNVSGGWTFAADLPSQHFMSPLQQSLTPGESDDLIVGFDHGYSTGAQQTITVYADPNNAVYETNEQNNVASRTIGL